jgi:peroxiredoxin Q/BCP
MEAYRDQYAQLFNNGNGVTVLAVSTDPVEMQQAWAAEAKFPVTFVSDPTGVAGNAYDVKYPAINMYRRVLFVIDKQGRIAHIMRPFRELSTDAYSELGEAVKKALATN